MNVLEALNESYERSLRNPYRFSTVAKADSASITQHFELQDSLRPLYGKGPAVAPSFGDHPDYRHLKGTQKTETGAVTTMFLDMEGSTRLGLLYGPAEVFKYKNAVIQVTIDIIRAFDGHVHRIMGDAVMAFFGRKGGSPEDGALDALNCASALDCLMSKLLENRFSEMRHDKFGVRIGIDHGREILWSAYGYPGMEEVTATGFQVDAAAKLQHAAGRNQIMLGASFCDLLDIPGEVLRQKTITRGDEEIVEPYLLPNYSGRDGKPVNYKKYILKADEYLRCTPLAKLAGSPPRFSARVDVARAKTDAAIEAQYFSAASCLDKSKHLRFEVAGVYQNREAMEVEFVVENHGQEAAKEKDNGDHMTPLPYKGEPIKHWEHCGYKGLHYMTINLRSPSKVLSSERIGVWIR